MPSSSQPGKIPPEMKGYAVAALVLWTVAIALSALWNIQQMKEKTLETALAQAQYAYLKDISFRRWNAMHGRVYVPATETTPPNPYLKDISERDISTPSGRRLTMMNPAYMTRQLYELMKKEYGILGHITSLKPIRPQNAPDAWETKALQMFAQGRTEFNSVEEIEGKAYLRHMKPLATEKSCLTCHAKQGYHEGDIRGGISVSIPMEPLTAIERGNTLRLAAGHILLWFIGAGGLFLGTRRILVSDSKRRRMEEVLQASEEKYRNIFDNAVEGMFQSTPGGRFLGVNKALVQIFGYENAEEMIAAITDMGEQIYVNPEDRLRLHRNIEEYGRVEKFETQVRKKDGTTIWVSIHANALKDGAGKTMSWAGIVEDISARKEMEEKLQKHTEEITDLYNNAPCGYHSLAPDGVFLLVNDTELQWLGYTRDEIIGRKNFADLITAESREAFHLNMLLLEKQGWVAEQKYELVRKDGTIFPVVVNSKVITDHEGKFAANRSTVFDITGLKQAEEELNRLNDNLEQRVEARTEELKKAKRVALSIMQDANIERERAKGMLEKLQASSEQLNILSNALEQSPSSVVITDREGQIEYVNPKFENLTGYSAKEALGSKPRILRSGVHGDAFYQNLWQTIMSGKEWHGEICNRKKDGQLYWEQASISAIRNNAGEIIKYVSVREDITERKHLDEKLKQQLEELERFNRLTIDREERMIELKKEINSLLKHTGEEEKYRIVEE